MAKEKVTSRRIATLAARILADPKAPASQKQVAGSALAQAASARRKAR